MKRRDLLKLIAITPLTRALQAGTITKVQPIQEGEVPTRGVTRTLLTDTEVLQFREGELKIFEVPDCKSMTIYAEEENSGPIYFGAEKDPASDGLKLQPGRQFIAGDVPAAHLYAIGSTDDLMIITFQN